MRLFHSVTVTVFSKEEDATQEKAFRAFFPFVLEKEKLQLGKTKATGLSEKKITIYDVLLQKEAHINRFLQWLIDRLDKDQKAMLLRQVDSRLDAELTFFLRFDRTAWNEEERLLLVDHGDCYHLKMRVAAYPKERKAATAILLNLLSPKEQP